MIILRKKHPDFFNQTLTVIPYNNTPTFPIAWRKYHVLSFYDEIGI